MAAPAPRPTRHVSGRPWRSPSNPATFRARPTPATIVPSDPVDQDSPRSNVFYRKLNRRYPRIVRGEGCYLFDADGRRFTDELAPRDQVTAAILDRMAADGTDHVMLDLR